MKVIATKHDVTLTPTNPKDIKFCDTIMQDHDCVTAAFRSDTEGMYLKITPINPEDL